MFHLANRIVRVLEIGVLTSLALAIATGCSKEERAPEPATSGAAAKSEAKPEPKKPADVSITGVHTGLGVGQYEHVAQEQSRFAPKDKIMISVHSDGSAKTATIGVRWLDARGKVVDDSSKDVVYNGSLATLFSLSKSDGLPAGKYRAEIRLNGWLAETAEIEIE